MPGLGLGLGLDFLDAGTRVRDNAFKITVDTTQAGSASDTFVLPLHNGTSYDFEVDWGDGVIESVSGSSLSSKSHTYSTGGTYQIAITGTFPHIYFNNGGDKAKLSSIDNWGDIVWSSMNAAFFGCSNMIGTYTDAPDTSSVTSMGQMFRNCSSFNSPVNFDTSSVTSMNFMFQNCSSFNQSVSGFDTSSVTSMQDMFRDCSSFNQSVSSFDTSSVTSMSSMFRGCSSFKQSLATFDMTSVANVTNMLFGCDINEAGTTTNYDNTLIAWEAQDLVDGLNFNGGTSKYSTTAEAARDAIINDDSWVITDGGIAEGILDLYTGAAAAYSLRQLATGSQTVVRVRRSSDNAEDDFTATEVVDGTMLAWVGTTASDDGFVTTWYDQSGNSNDVTQSTAAYQPKIVDSGVLIEENGRPAVDFENNEFVEAPIGLLNNVNYAHFFIAAGLGSNSSRNDIINFQVSTAVSRAFLSRGFTTDNKLTVGGRRLDGDSFQSFTTTNTHTGHLLLTAEYNWQDANIKLYVDSVNEIDDTFQTSGSTSATDANNNFIGKNGVLGKAQEIILYTSDQSANRTGIETNINNHYNIYP